MSDNRAIIRNPPPASVDLDTMYHGGIVRTSGPYPKEADAGERLAKEFHESIAAGLSALENGTSPFVPDMEAVPGAAVEAFDIFDIQSGDHIMIWRVACRERSKHAN